MRYIAVALAIATTPAAALSQGDDGMGYSQPSSFDQGSVSVTLALGASSYVTRTYYILGGGVGYFLIDGLELSFDLEHWFVDGPFDITKISPGLRYILHFMPVFHPYGGVFYRHWFLHSDFAEDADTIGARVGAIYAPGRLWIGVGGMYEFILTDCDTNCGAWSPEISIGVSF